MTRLGLETGALTSIARDTLATTRAIESTAVNTFGLSDEPPVFARGEGALLFDERGARWIDLVCGSSVTNLGHGNARIADAIRSILDTGILHTGTRLPSPPRAALYEALVELAPDGLDVVHLANSGSEAIEIALKAAQHATGRSEVVAFFGAYHGRTRGALSVTASARARAAFRPFDTAVHFMPYPYGLRPPIPGHSQHTIGDACLAYLDDALSNPFSGIAPSALIVEAVQGVAGVVIPPLGFLKGLRRICDQHGIVMILDEIWNGFGRSGLWFAFERDEVTPDLVVFGKALSGSLPLSGVVGRPELLKKWAPGTHTSTFQGNPLACAAAVASIDDIKSRRLLERTRDQIEPALIEFGARIEPIGGVAETRCLGAQAGIELITHDGAPDQSRVRAVQARCLRDGVLVYGGGWHSNVLMLVPPLVITAEELAEGLGTVECALRASG